MSAPHPMVLKAARAWCKRHAEACGMDEKTLWAERAAGFITEAQAALEACGALELERDARRYRWLRSHAAVETENGPWAVEWCEEIPVREAGSTVPLIGDELDDAVDIAIASAEVGP